MYSHYNSIEALNSALRAALAANREHFSGFLVRCVATKDRFMWVNRFCTFRAFNESEAPLCKESLRDYGQVGLFEMVLSPEEFLQVVSKMETGEVPLGKFHVRVGVISNWIEEKVSSQNSYCEAPARVFRGRLAAPPASSETSLVHYELESFPTLSHATKAWSGLRNPSVAGSSEIGTVIIVVPEYRAAIHDLSRRDGQAYALIGKGESAKNLVLQLTWVCNGVTSHARISVIGRELQLPAIHDSEELYIWLVDESGEILDSHQEFAFQPRNMRKVIRSDNSNESLASIVNAIDNGEGERTEFKPFIKPGDAKLEEVVRTAIAFANSKGGRILIGVNDACQIVGLEPGLLSAYKHHSRGKARTSNTPNKDASSELWKEACNWYIGTLRSRLRGDIFPDLDFEIDAVELLGQTVVVIAIDDGLKGVYQSKEKGAGVWVRRGANNVHAAPNEWPRLLERQAPFGLR